MLLKHDDRNLEQTQQLLDIEKFSSSRTRRMHFGEIRDTLFFYIRIYFLRISRLKFAKF